MKKILFLAVVFVLCSAGVASAACTAEEAQQKALTYAQAVQEKSQKDREGYNKFMDTYKTKIMELQKNPDDLDALCKFYDDALQELKK